MSHLRIAVIGLGRIGQIHAQNCVRMAAKGSPCQLVAIVEPQAERREACVAALTQEQGAPVRGFASVHQLLEATAIEAAVVSSTTASHYANAKALVQAGCRVLLEKPLTDSPEGDREFTHFLNAHRPEALMLAFQRRFDAPLQWAKSMIDQGRIGRPFKFVSILEDSNLMPTGYQTPGLLRDMAIHNVDELLWLSGQKPSHIRHTGSRIYSHALTNVDEDFDDALLQFQLGEGAIGQIQVSRNHVAGYRCETWVYGEEGMVHVGEFHQNDREVLAEAFGRDRAPEKQIFPLPPTASGAPEFVARFGPSYARELEVFLDHLTEKTAFPVDQNDGLRATEVLENAQAV